MYIYFPFLNLGQHSILKVGQSIKISEELECQDAHNKLQTLAELRTSWLRLPEAHFVFMF